MALDDMLIDELGIGPMWVRRGMNASVPETAQAVSTTLREIAHEVPTPEAARAVPTAEVAREVRTTEIARDVQTRGVPPEAPTPGVRSDAVSAPPATAKPVASQSEAAASEKPGDGNRAQGSDQYPQSQSPTEEPLTDTESPPFEAYDDLPWTDDTPAAPAIVAEAAPSDVHTLGWDALEQRVATCEQCRLCERRTNTVFGVGDREADWMLIGEAPGENEDKQGEPFVGQAGKLLDNMLRALGLSRESNVYIANVIKCRPPGNRNPDLDEIARCEPYLQRQVELVKPKVIVALGRFAAQSLLKNEASISSMRGRVHEYRGVPVVVTYHPAYLLRSLPEKAKAWVDLCLARGAYRDAMAALGVEPSSSNKARDDR